MGESADAVVIGGGCMGTSIAYNLKRRGVDRVTLLEKNFVGSGATGRSVGVVRQHYSTEFMVRMAMSSLRTIRHFQRELGADSGYRRTGLIVAVGGFQSPLEFVEHGQFSHRPHRKMGAMKRPRPCPGGSLDSSRGECQECASPRCCTRTFP